MDKLLQHLTVNEVRYTRYGFSCVAIELGQLEVVKKHCESFIWDYVVGFGLLILNDN